MRKPIEWRSASKTNYKKFCKTYPDITISFLEWKNIIYGYSEWFRNYILETGDKLKLPGGLGEFSILKMKRNHIREINGKVVTDMPVDWKKTAERGKLIFNLNYHTDGYSFRWIWFRRTSMIPLHRLWFFKANRPTSRTLAHYLNVDKKYQHLYKEWPR